jgi:hypothetical protein
MILISLKKWKMKILKILDVFHAMDVIDPIAIDVYLKRKNN